MAPDSTTTAVRNAGFTLPELLTTLVVVAVLAAAAVPGLRAFVQNNRVAAQTDELVAALNLARSEAVVRSTSVSMCSIAGEEDACTSDGDWSGGWLVYVDGPPVGEIDEDDVVLRRFPALEGGTTLAGPEGPLTYRPDGFLGVTDAQTFELRVPDCTGDGNRDVVVAPAGRAAVGRVGC